MGKQYQIIKPKHGYFKGGVLEADISPTIDTGVGCWHTLIGESMEAKIIEPIAYDEQNGYLRQDGCIGTLTTDGSRPKHNNRVVEPTYRIRKLTERECFRLMGVKDGDFEKVRYGQPLPSGSHRKIVNRTMNERQWKACWRILRHDRQSTSSCYHLSGDSIVTAVLMAIFGELFGVNDYKYKINNLVDELKGENE